MMRWKRESKKGQEEKRWLGFGVSSSLLAHIRVHKFST